MDPVGRGDLELIGGIDLGGELPTLLGGPLEPEGLVPIPSAPAPAGVTAAAGGLGARERSRVSGLNWRTMMRWGVPRSGSTTTMPERMGLGMSA